MMLDFVGFPKIPRLSREIVITEKIDGTNGCIYISTPEEVVDGWAPMLVGSRTRWIIPGDDNHGFAQWAYENAEELLKLGLGRHFGEWWGQGIQRKYGLNEKRFSLFNVSRWNLETKPLCCHVVPILWAGDFKTENIEWVLHELARTGSQAAPGYMYPEGIVIYHAQGNILFKKSLVNDGAGKNEALRG